MILHHYHKLTLTSEIEKHHLLYTNKKGEVVTSLLIYQFISSSTTSAKTVINKTAKINQNSTIPTPYDV